MGRLVILENVAEDGFATKIPAEVWRFDGNSGLVKVSAGFPCTPGLVSEANLDKVRVFVSGVEQRIAVEPLRGLHPDGSYRAIGIQLEKNLTSGAPLAAEVWVGSRVRGTVDLLWEEPTAASMLNKAVIAPTDPQYLCDSYVALMPMQPQSADTGNAATFFNTDTGEMADWLAYMDAQTPSPIMAGATYEHVHAMQEAWLRTGVRAHYERWYTWLYAQMTAEFYLPGASVGGNAYAKVTAVDPTLPEPGATNEGLYQEWHSMVVFGWATGYLLTAWKQPWRQLSHKLSWTMNGASYAMSVDEIQRYNMSLVAGPLLAAYAVEATMQVGNGPLGYGDGRDPNVRTFAAQLPSFLADLESHKYAAYGSGFADGIIGQRQTATSSGSLAAGVFPLFQLMLAARALMWYYNNIAPDSRIPAWLKAMADLLVTQATPAGDFAYWPYLLRDDDGFPPPDPIGEDGINTNTEPYWAAFYSELFGFMYAYETDPTGKATYLTWLNRSLNRDGITAANFNKTGKAFGEYFGMHSSAAYYLAGGTVRGVVGAHPTVITEPPIWES